jgi:formylglycine-generating enzyme required for sulfatase activity
MMPNPRVVTDPQFRAAIEATGLPWRVRDNATSIELLLVPPGSFMMGCSPGAYGSGCNDFEYPVHSVTLTRPFYLGRFEVTQAQWMTAMDNNPSQLRGPHHPVDRVSWELTRPFLTRTRFRLPTEAEWEYACRGGTTTAYNNGSNDPSTLDSIAWIPSGFQPVGLKWANFLGFHDMHQNVWEWVEDYFGYYASAPVTDPTGAPGGLYRVYRGGGGDGGPSWYACRSSFRMAGLPTRIWSHLGFRVARTP